MKLTATVPQIIFELTKVFSSISILERSCTCILIGYKYTVIKITRRRLVDSGTLSNSAGELSSVDRTIGV